MELQGSDTRHRKHQARMDLLNFKRSHQQASCWSECSQRPCATIAQRSYCEELQYPCQLQPDGWRHHPHEDGEEKEVMRLHSQCACMLLSLLKTKGSAPNDLSMCLHVLISDSISKASSFKIFESSSISDSKSRSPSGHKVSLKLMSLRDGNVGCSVFSFVTVQPNEE